MHLRYQTLVDELIDATENITSISEVEVDEQDLFYTNSIELQQKYAKIICEASVDEFVYPNKPYQYTLVISNVGNCLAENVSISSVLPKSYVLDSLLIEGEYTDDYSIHNDELNFEIDFVDANSLKTVIINGKIKR